MFWPVWCSQEGHYRRYLFFSSSKLEFALLKWPAGEHLLTIFIGQSIHHLLLQEGNCWDKQQTMKKAEQRLENEMLWWIRTWENSHQPIPGNPGGQLYYQSGKRLEVRIWLNKLILCLRWRHPIWVLILVLGAPLPIQFPTVDWESSAGWLGVLGPVYPHGRPRGSSWL